MTMTQSKQLTEHQISLADEYIEKGNELEDNGQLDEAIQHYLTALETAEGYWRAYLNLGIAYNIKGDFEPALNYLEQAYQQFPDSHITAYNLARILFLLGQDTSRVIQLLEKAVELEHDFFEGWILLAEAFDVNQQTVQAVESANQALTLHPNHFGALWNKAQYLLKLAPTSETWEIQAHHLLKQLSPHDKDIRTLFANFLLERGYSTQAIQVLQEHYDFDLNHFSHYLWALLFTDQIRAEDIAEEHKKINAFLIPEEYPEQLDLSTVDKIKVGFLSADLYQHKNAYFLQSVFTYLNPEKFEIYVYNLSRVFDKVSEQLKQPHLHWFDVQYLSDEQIVAKIREDGVHILFDLAGHSRDNRLTILAQKPAPIITSWLGYLATTGLNTVDFRLVDAVTDPVGLTEAHHTEQLIRIKNTQWCYTPQAETPDIVPNAYHEKGYITFGSFNQCAKVTQTCLDTWLRILQEIPESRIFFAGVEQGLAQERIEDFLLDNGIDETRYAFQGRVSWIDYFSSYNQVDIALDSYPYTGATTTFDALVMGTPVITLAGQHSISRSASSILTALGHSEWIAQSADDYVEIAKTLAEQIQQQPEFKHLLRQEFLLSSLIDGQLFAQNFADALDEMVQRYQANV